MASGIYSTIEVEQSVRHKALVNHVKRIDDFVRKDHESLVEVEDLTHSLYEYTHEEFRKTIDDLRQLRCAENGNIAAAMITLMRRDRILSKLYSDRAAAVTSVFEAKPTPVLIPVKTLAHLMKKNAVWFNGTIFEKETSLIYQFGTVMPVSPINSSAIAYILRLPRILLPSLTSVFCLNNLGITKMNSLVRFKLPKFVVAQNKQLKEMNTGSCTTIDQMTFLCSASLHIKDNECLANHSACRYEAKKVEKTEWIGGQYGYLVASNGKCRQ